MTRYLRTPARQDDTQPPGRLRMFCFPYAGGGASAYAGWQHRLGPRVEVMPVQLPGREGRLAEPRFTELTALVEELDEELGPELTGPHILYGHSMGALIAFALAQHRHRRGAPLPCAVVIGAFRAPHLPPPRIAPPDAPDEVLIQRLAELGGIPQVLLDHPEWLAALLPVVRDDLLLCTDPPVRADLPLPVPLHVFAGLRDSLVTPPEVRDWQLYTEGGFTLRMLPGGHFFQRELETEFLAELGALAEGLSRPAADPPAPAARPAGSAYASGRRP
jgi:surfactin synthase thioesterase subunit